MSRSAARKKGIPLTIRLLRMAVVYAVLTAVVALFITQPSCSHYPPTSATLDPYRLRIHVEILSNEFAPRNYLHVQNLDACAQYIFTHFEKTGGHVSKQVYAPESPSAHADSVRNRSYRNVIASFGPDGGPRIVVGAHYDVCGETPGADDNASGIAGLLELAALLGQTELRQRVDLVAYTLEEPPFFRSVDMGSSRHAYSLKREGVEVEAMICLEMIGFFSDAKGSQRSPSLLLNPLTPDEADFIAIVGGIADRKLLRKTKAVMRGATDLPVFAMCAPRGFAGIDLSDHRNYWNQGFKAVMVTDTSFYRNPRYHQASDTPDTLDYERMGKVVLGVYEAVVRLANEDD